MTFFPWPNGHFVTNSIQTCFVGLYHDYYSCELASQKTDFTHKIAKIMHRPNLQRATKIRKYRLNIPSIASRVHAFHLQAFTLKYQSQPHVCSTTWNKNYNAKYLVHLVSIRHHPQNLAAFWLIKLASPRTQLRRIFY